ncbi:MAG: DUF924 family protein [Phenylobacterium sp.]|jgi:uncharacterized protein (DUF924 family)|uniref:DUF924 family protein n=1 Tax=Phenylobacterium sp. TaxID=1871053 RepID=UPI001B7C1793|nr:DUF924 family protein [Phenylobacterium sp.]MBP7651722.1 DUF924 family protein [Phenylobacterium sp.]MBP7817704.1 DUF924 family protein [Phenylobacterium sp.]MBP9232231.1 DUF924 family protein [Phenylobacterium sp.]MBP9755692.1 DUF924 family protein [Phenylobacterium sp.]
MPATPHDITGFWRTAGPKRWFAKNPNFDAAIQLKFEPVHYMAALGRHDKWMETAEGSLALLILLDQFPRNLWRNTGHAFATDGKARLIARHAVAAGQDLEIEPLLRPFVYLPFEHSEDMADQDESLRLFTALGDPDTLRYAELHRDIIQRFGRFPHRNACLGRTTTAQEQEFLDEGGFAG